MTSPERIDAKLDTVRRRTLVRDALLAAARTVAMLAPVCLALAWLDYELDFGALLRAVALVLLLALGARAVLRCWIPVLAVRRDRVGTAHAVERALPELRGRLIARVEFRGEGEAGLRARGASAALAEAFCRRLEEDAAALEFERAVRWRALRGVGLFAASAAALLIAAALAWPDRAALWVTRTALPWAEAPWPRRTHLEGIAEAYRVRRGDRLLIAGRAAGALPSSGEITWRTAAPAGGEGGAARFAVGDDGRFTAATGPLLETAEVDIEAGDASRAGIRAEVIIVPELASLEATYTYPSFTGLAPERTRSGDVRAIVGTRIDLTLTADKPVARMEMTHKFGEEVRTEALTLEGGLTGRAFFEVTARGTYEVRLFDAYGFSADAPGRFVVEPLENELPSVRVARPGAEHVVTPATALRLRYEVGDDFGVVAAGVRWERRPGVASPAARPEAEVPIPLGGRRERTLRGEFRWDLERADAAPGDVIVFHVEARDEGAHLAAARAGASGMQVLKVVDAESLRTMLEARRGDAVGELRWAAREESQVRDAVSALVLALPAGDEAPSATTLPRLQDEEGAQTRIRRRLERLDAAFEELADALEESFLAEAGRVAGLRAIAEGLRALSRGPCAEAAQALAAARGALSAQPADTAAGRRQLASARTAQEQALAGLAQLIAGESRASSLGELVTDIAALRDAQSALVRGARALLPRTFGKSLEALAEEDRDALQKLGAEAALIGARFGDWQRAFERRAADAPSALKDLASRASASPAAELLEKTAQAIGKNRLSDATAAGRSAIDALTRLVLALEVESLQAGDLRDRRLRALEELLECETRAAVRAADARTPEALRQERREQYETCERARPLAFQEAGLPAQAGEHMAGALRAMEAAEAACGRERGDEALASMRKAIDALALAVEIVRLTDVQAVQARLPAPPSSPRTASPPGAIAGAFGAGSGGVDLNALAQLGADIALVSRLRERQAQLLDESLGTRKEEPAAAERQRVCAAQVPQLARRVEVYLPPAGQALQEAGRAMTEAADRVGAGDRTSAAARQKVALAALATAEEKLRELWTELLETLARISRAVESGPSHGAAGSGEEREMPAASYAVLIRELVRLGRLIKDEEALIARTRAWSEATVAADADGVREAAAAQRALAARGQEIASALGDAGGEGGSLVAALGEACPFLAGAADMLEKERYDKALERQETALEYLGEAWTVVTQAAAAAASSRDVAAADSGARTGTATSGAGLAGGTREDGKPWYWDLPPRARDAVGQSLESRFVPRYAPAIERYYERLAKRRQAARAGKE